MMSYFLDRSFQQKFHGWICRWLRQEFWIDPFRFTLVNLICPVPVQNQGSRIQPIGRSSDHIMKRWSWETSIWNSDCTPCCKKHLITICSHTFCERNESIWIIYQIYQVAVCPRSDGWLSSMAIQWKVSCQGLVKNRSTDGCFTGRTTMAAGVANASFHACLPYHSRHCELQFRGNGGNGFFKLKGTLGMLDASEFLMDGYPLQIFSSWNDMKPIQLSKIGDSR